MKKYITVLLSVTFVVLTMLTGCDKDNSNSQNEAAKQNITLSAMVSLVASTDCRHLDFTTDKTLEDWYIQKYGETVVPEPKEHVTVIFDGKEYHGKEFMQKVNRFGMGTYYRYTGDHGFLTINAVTGELTDIEFTYQYVNTPISDKLFEKCEKEAQRIAEQYIDTSYFVLEKEASDIGMYFNYYQYVGGVKTENVLQVHFNCKGRLLSFACYVSDGYKLIYQEKSDSSEKEIAELNSDKAKQLVLTTSKDIMKENDIDEKKIKEYEISEKALYVMPDGKLVKVYSYEGEIWNPVDDKNGDMLYSVDQVNVDVAVFAE